MIDANKIIANFQMIASRVVKFDLETREVDENNVKVNVKNEFDYDIISVEEFNDAYFGAVQFKTTFIAKKGKSVLFKILIIYEGKFIGNKNHLKFDDFKNMLELNGVVTLSQLTRSYVLSATALAGINPPVKIPMINVHMLKKIKENKNEEK